MTAGEAIDALARAGVRLTAAVRERNAGDPMMAFIDAIALTDSQQVTLPISTVDQLRDLFDRLSLRPDSDLRRRVSEALERIEHRAA